MRVFKLKDFARWSKKESLKEVDLIYAVEELVKGLFDANLGAYLYKKRIAIKGKGKRSGFRSILAYKSNDRIIFMYGFSKNEKANITEEEKKALRRLARIYINFSDEEIKKATEKRELMEIKL